MMNISEISDLKLSMHNNIQVKNRNKTLLKNTGSDYFVKINNTNNFKVSFSGMTQYEESLFIAISYGNGKMVKKLLENPYLDVNTRDKKGNTPLHLAVFKGDIEMIKALSEREDIDINATDKNKNTALHIAAVMGNIEAVNQLIKHKNINRNAKNDYGETAFDLVTSKILNSNNTEDEYNMNIELLNLLSGENDNELNTNNDNNNNLIDKHRRRESRPRTRRFSIRR